MKDSSWIDHHAQVKPLCIRVLTIFGLIPSVLQRSFKAIKTESHSPFQGRPAFSFGVKTPTNFIGWIRKINEKFVIVLNVNNVLSTQELEVVKHIEEAESAVDVLEDAHQDWLMEKEANRRQQTSGALSSPTALTHASAHLKQRLWLHRKTNYKYTKKPSSFF